MIMFKVLCVLPFLPGIFCLFPSYFDSAQGSAVGHATALEGNAASHGTTRTNAFGDSISEADAHASGVHPVADSKADSASGGYLPRWRRFADGTAIATGSAAEGTGDSHSSTFTAGGASNSNADGSATGSAPSATSIASSHSARKKRGGDGFPPFFPGRATGTAIGTSGALRGESRSTGETHTFGGRSDSRSSASARGVNPTSTSIATSESNRRKRSPCSSITSWQEHMMCRAKRAYPSPYPGQAFGSAEGVASALEGRSMSSGNTFTSGGNSMSNGQALSVGVQPVANSRADSTSHGYWKREVAATKAHDAASTGAGFGDMGVLATGSFDQPKGGKIILAQSDFSSNGSNAHSVSVASVSSKQAA